MGAAVADSPAAGESHTKEADMNKRKCVLSLLLCIAPLCRAQELDLPELARKVRESVVQINTYNQAGELIGSGSGFFYGDEGDLITSRHVLAGADRAEAQVSKDEVYPVLRIVAEDAKADIVRVTVDAPRKAARPLTLNPRIPEAGQRVVVIGSPLGLEHTVSDGIISAVRDIPGYGTIIQTTAPVSPGSSGSPLLNMAGEVIGVVTFQLVAGQNLNFVVPASCVAALQRADGKTLAQWRDEQERNQTTTPSVHYLLGVNRLLAEDYVKALAHFEQAATGNPADAEAFFYVGYCHGKLGREAKAMEAYKQSIRINPDDAEAHSNLGVAYGNVGRYTEAIEACKQAIRIKPDYAQAHYGLGVAYGMLGRHAEAVEAFKQAIRIKLDYPDAHYNLGVTYGDLARYAEAIEAFKQAIRMKPDYAQAHSNLGCVYGKLGRNAEATEAFKQAVRIKPDYAGAHLGLGITYVVTGRKDSALDEYKILKELDQDSADKLFNLIYK